MFSVDFRGDKFNWNALHLLILETRPADYA